MDPHLLMLINRERERGEYPTMACGDCGCIIADPDEQMGLRAQGYCDDCTEKSSPWCPNPACGGRVVDLDGNVDACDGCSHYTTTR